MKKQQNLLTFVIASFIAVAGGCRLVNEEPSIPNPGFAIYTSYRSVNGVERILAYARTKGQVGVSYFGYLRGTTPDTTGRYDSFDVTANDRAKAYVDNGMAPAFYSITAVSGWDICDGGRAGIGIERGVFNPLICQAYRFGTPTVGGSLSTSTIDVTAAPVQFTQYGEGIDATYGMPTFQFINQYGTLVAQTQACEIDTDNGWAKGWSNCLTGLPFGPYTVLLINATADGTGQRVSVSNIYLAGGPNINPIDDAGFFVNQQYLDFLSHDPDEAGWNYWTSQITQCVSDTACVGQKRIDASKSFWYTDEFLQQQPGLCNSPGVVPDFNNAEFVRLCYYIYLQRGPDQAGYDGWLAQLNSTNDDNSIISGFINSAEYRARFEPQPSPDVPPEPEPQPCSPNMACTQ